MITMDVSNSNDEINTFHGGNIILNNPDDIISGNIEEKKYNFFFQNILQYIWNLKLFIFENFNNIYGNFLHIYFIIVFEILFYFNYVINIEYKEIQKVLKTFSSDLTKYFGDIINDLPNNQGDLFDQMCNNIDNNYLYKKNEILKQNAYNIIWALSIFLIIIIGMHCIIIKDIKKLIYKSGEAVLFISCIAIFEYYFFTNIITKYNVMTSEEASCFLYKDILN